MSDVRTAVGDTGTWVLPRAATSRRWDVVRFRVGHVVDAAVLPRRHGGPRLDDHNAFAREGKKSGWWRQLDEPASRTRGRRPNMNSF